MASYLSQSVETVNKAAGLFTVSVANLSGTGIHCISKSIIQSF